MRLAEIGLETPPSSCPLESFLLKPEAYALACIHARRMAPPRHMILVLVEAHSSELIDWQRRASAPSRSGASLSRSWLARAGWICGAAPIAIVIVIAVVVVAVVVVVVVLDVALFSF